MAKESLSHPDNAPGELFVDTRCIGCEVCTQLAPETFVLQNDLSRVTHQPENADETSRALVALLSCPVFSIGLREGRERISAAAETLLPMRLHENVFFCGYNARSSYAASSYLILRETGNILIDSPRFDPRLVRAVEALGGVQYIYLTHRDDIADYAKFKAHFGADVIYHADDFNARIREAEITLHGNETFHLDDEVQVIPQSGHTKGHTVLLYKNYFLFSGDHLAYDGSRNRLHAFRDYCWYDWKTQLASLRRLSAYDFAYLLPGHGERFHADAATMKTMLKTYLDLQPS